MIETDIYGWALQCANGGLTVEGAARLQQAAAELAATLNDFPRLRTIAPPRPRPADPRIITRTLGARR